MLHHCPLHELNWPAAPEDLRTMADHDDAGTPPASDILDAQ